MWIWTKLIVPFSNYVHHRVFSPCDERLFNVKIACRIFHEPSLPPIICLTMVELRIIATCVIGSSMYTRELCPRDWNPSEFNKLRKKNSRVARFQDAPQNRCAWFHSNCVTWSHFPALRAPNRYQMNSHFIPHNLFLFIFDNWTFCALLRHISKAFHGQVRAAFFIFDEWAPRRRRN